MHSHAEAWERVTQDHRITMPDHCNRYPLLTSLALLLATAWLYLPGLSGPLLFDDQPNIFNNPAFLDLHGFDSQAMVAATWSGDAGPLKRPVSMLSFALNYAATGADPYYFKLTNLILHLLTGLSLGYLTWRILAVYQQCQVAELSLVRRQWLSLLVMAVWLWHPLNLSPVLHVVQRMTQLAALFTVGGLLAYLAGRTCLLTDGRSPSGWLWLAVGLIGGTALAALSKENGALLPLLALLLEALLFDFACRTPRARRWLIGVCAALLSLSVVATLAYLGAFKPGGLSAAFANRPFSLEERVLTQGRVLWFYVRLLLWPDIRQMGLFHDDFLLSTGLTAPLTTLLAWLGWWLMLLLAFIARRKAPLFSLGIGFFLIGHVMESSIVALDMLYEHRNYLPAYGLLLTLVYYLTHPRLWRWPRSPLSPRIGASALAVVLLGVCGYATAARAAVWSSSLSLLQTSWENHPRCERTAGMFGEALLAALEQRRAQGEDTPDMRELQSFLRGLFAGLQAVDDYYLVGPILSLRLDELEGKAANPALLSALTERLRQPPLSINAVGLLYGQTSKRLREQQGLSIETLLPLYAAMLENPRLRGDRKARVLGEYARLLAYRDEPSQALAYAAQAVKLNPDEPSLRKLWSGLLLKAGRMQAVRLHGGQ